MSRPASRIDEIAAAGTRALRNLDGCLDHRQGEALDAESVMPDIAPLRFQQPFRELLGIGMLGEEFYEPLLRQSVETLVLPERVVCIEADGRDRGHGHH
jgi:hypothetical protein